MQNLEHVKPGDELVVPARGRGFHSVAVDRVTATQIVCKVGHNGEWRIRRRDGLVMDGHTGMRRFAQPMTDEMRADLELERRVNAARAALQAFKVTPENVDLVEELLRADQRDREMQKAVADLKKAGQYSDIVSDGGFDPRDRQGGK